MGPILIERGVRTLPGTTLSPYLPRIRTGSVVGYNPPPVKRSSGADEKNRGSWGRVRRETASAARGTGPADIEARAPAGTGTCLAKSSWIVVPRTDLRLRPRFFKNGAVDRCPC